VGKTTLVKDIQTKFPQSKYFNCDEGFVRQNLNQLENSQDLKEFFGDSSLIIIDEAQRVANIGLKLKLMVDNYPQTQFLVTGSSSLELGKEIGEPLTGRKIVFNLYSLACEEVGLSKFELKNPSFLEKVFRFGLYPEIFTQTDQDKTKEKLDFLVDSYLYKDILELVEIRNSREVLEKLLQLLAFQVGNEVSFSKLASDLNINQETVQKYISLLEDAFVIFKLPAFSRNLRQEIFKTRKIYFYDLGIRNSLIKNYNPLNFRDDLGKLFENFVIVERLKHLKYNHILANLYFWRNYAQAEIDYIEEKDGVLNCFEFKWNDRKKAKLPKSFQENYPNHTFEVINRENWWKLVG
jgi:predicted AAA+ superfamily ATPase